MRSQVREVGLSQSASCQVEHAFGKPFASPATQAIGRECGSPMDLSDRGRGKRREREKCLVSGSSAARLKVEYGREADEIPCRAGLEVSAHASGPNRTSAEWARGGQRP